MKRDRKKNKNKKAQTNKHNIPIKTKRWRREKRFTQNFISNLLLYVLLWLIIFSLKSFLFHSLTISEFSFALSKCVLQRLWFFFFFPSPTIEAVSTITANTVPIFNSLKKYKSQFLLHSFSKTNNNKNWNEKSECGEKKTKQNEHQSISKMCAFSTFSGILNRKDNWVFKNS